MSMKIPPQDITDSHLNLLKNKIGCDVTFLVGPDQERIEFHKIFLIARSLQFKIDLDYPWTKATTKTYAIKEGETCILMPEVSPEAFQSFLQFVYSDFIFSDNSVLEMGELLYLADKYNMPKLMRKCEMILESKLEVPNIIQIHSMASKYALEGLLRDAKYVIESQFWALIDHPSFLSVDAEFIKQFLAGGLVGVHELDLFRALMTWAKLQCRKTHIEPTGKNIRGVLGEILMYIRFPLIKVEHFTEYVIPKGVLTQEETTLLLDYFKLSKKRQIRVTESEMKFSMQFREWAPPNFDHPDSDRPDSDDYKFGNESASNESDSDESASDESASDEFASNTTA